MNKTKKGFTLIELIAVLAILGIIMAIAVPTGFGSINEAQKAADRASLDGYNSAIRIHASFAASDPLLTKNLDTALNNAGINVDAIPQSDISVLWVPPTTNACGYFEAVAQGTANSLKLSPQNGSYGTQIVKAARIVMGESSDVPII